MSFSNITATSFALIFCVIIESIADDTSNTAEQGQNTTFSDQQNNSISKKKFTSGQTAGIAIGSSVGALTLGTVGGFGVGAVTLAKALVSKLQGDHEKRIDDAVRQSGLDNDDPVIKKLSNTAKSVGSGLDQTIEIEKIHTLGNYKFGPNESIEDPKRNQLRKELVRISSNHLDNMLAFKPGKV